MDDPGIQAARELLDSLARLGLSVELRGGKPSLRGPRQQMTPELLDALARHRLRIIHLLVEPPPRQWLWRLGHTFHETPEMATYGDTAWNPAGAWWWRRRGQQDWLPVPGVNPFGLLPPGGHRLAAQRSVQGVSRQDTEGAA